MTPEQMKKEVAQEALKYVVSNTIIGVGTGSTTNFFIDALAYKKNSIKGCVASSEVTAERLLSYGIKILDLNDISGVSVYVDGADEADSELNLIKGGGGALTREKIIAATADKFVCIVDDSKLVKVMGSFPLAVEVIAMSFEYVKRQIIKKIGGFPVLRKNFISDNGNLILDVSGLKISNPKSVEAELNNITGVVANGLFANRGADILLVGTKNGVKTIGC